MQKYNIYSNNQQSYQQSITIDNQYVIQKPKSVPQDKGVYLITKKIFFHKIINICLTEKWMIQAVLRSIERRYFRFITTNAVR